MVGWALVRSMVPALANPCATVRATLPALPLACTRRVEPASAVRAPLSVLVPTTRTVPRLSSAALIVSPESARVTPGALVIDPGPLTVEEVSVSAVAAVDRPAPRETVEPVADRAPTPRPTARL